MNQIPKREFPLRFDNQPDQKPFVFEMNDSGRGLVLTVRASGGESRTALLPALSDGPLAQMTKYVGECAKAFVADVAGLHESFKGGELTNRIRSAAAARLGKACGQLQSQGIKEAQDVAASRAALTAVDPATVATAHLRADALAKWNAADRAGREAVAISEATPYETTAALIESGALTAVSDRARDAATERYMAQRLVAKSGSTAAHQIAPTYERPLAVGPDHRAAREAATHELNKLTARAEAVASVEDMLRRICDVLSPATNLSPHDIYNTFDRK
ncbi:hypothetical protein ABIF63_005761 [Bradyrhizobium japonicum]|uniref:Uncharacterized protein n=1 Tax=Bradyrhizobium japonicum TaxID=375 RepID=A0ABV2RXI3_BRAJP|nr:hypothetical protein [Bradyrhizobium japonicum]UQD95250.1 hypothetical protein JEY30_26900 [Bradyrhizobium japonicum]WLB23439.1 hypothetical protein QIH95_22365 [Bradyrhizobium japonicum]